MRIAANLLALFAVGTVVGVIVVRVVGPQSGPFALAAVVEEQLVLAGAIAATVALLLSLRASGRGRGWIAATATVSLVVAVVVLGSAWWSPPAPAAAGPASLRVLSWNLEFGSRAATTSVEGIAEREVDIIALQELTPDVAAAIEADPDIVAAYPYRMLQPREGVDGMGLLSRIPLAGESLAREPLVLHASVLLPGGGQLEVLDVHPYPPTITRTWRLPTGLDTRHRDDDLARIAAMVGDLGDPASAVVVGDFNAASSEPGFRAFDGLLDAHGEAGVGTGFTWRPSSLEGLGLGFLRIDHVLTGAGLRTVAIDEECRLTGDHCRLYVTLELTPPAG